jgi:hypothetical protein
MCSCVFISIDLCIDICVYCIYKCMKTFFIELIHIHNWLIGIYVCIYTCISSCIFISIDLIVDMCIYCIYKCMKTLRTDPSSELGDRYIYVYVCVHVYLFL